MIFSCQNFDQDQACFIIMSNISLLQSVMSILILTALSETMFCLFVCFLAGYSSRYGQCRLKFAATAFHFIIYENADDTS